MQGIFITTGGGPHRPKSKKAIKEALAAGELVLLEATSVFGNEPSGNVIQDVPAGQYYFVGPDPYTDRRFYGTLTVKPDHTVTVK